MSRLLVNRNAFTLMEILISTMLISLVFGAATSVYVTGLKFLQTAQTNDVTTLPAVSLEGISKAISQSNLATVNNVPNSQLDLRADYSCSSNFATSLATPSNNTDDQFWHYRFINSALRFVCDGTAGTNISGSDPILIPSVNTGASSFSPINPSAQGLATVIQIHLVTTTPAQTLDTNVAVGAEPKG